LIFENKGVRSKGAGPAISRQPSASSSSVFQFVSGDLLPRTNEELIVWWPDSRNGPGTPSPWCVANKGSYGTFPAIHVHTHDLKSSITKHRGYGREFRVFRVLEFKTGMLSIPRAKLRRQIFKERKAGGRRVCSSEPALMFPLWAVGVQFARGFNGSGTLVFPFWERWGSENMDASCAWAHCANLSHSEGLAAMMSTVSS